MLKNIKKDVPVSIEKTRENFKENPEYIQNQMEIDSIKKVLINSADVPEKLVDWLIEAVKSNTILEYNFKK